MTRDPHTPSPAIDSLAWLDAKEELLGNDGRILVVRPTPHPFWEHYQNRIHCYQTFRSYARVLHQSGLSSEGMGRGAFADLGALVGSGEFLHVIFIATRIHEENLATIATIVTSLPPAGKLLVCAENALGASRLDGLIREVCPVVRSESKAKSRVIVVAPADCNRAVLARWRARGEPTQIGDSELISVPGVFSSHEIDAGSLLLANHLPNGLRGRGADLGAGVGYLRACQTIT